MHKGPLLSGIRLPALLLQVILGKEGEQAGKSRGFGFVTYENPDDAIRAIDEINGRDIEGRPVRALSPVLADPFEPHSAAASVPLAQPGAC